MTENIQNGRGTREPTTVIEQLANQQTEHAKRLTEFVMGDRDAETLEVDDWLHPSRLSGGRISIHVEYVNIESEQWITVRSDTPHTVLDTDVTDSGPYLREVLRSGMEKQREGFVRITPVLTADTPFTEVAFDE